MALKRLVIQFNFRLGGGRIVHFLIRRSLMKTLTSYAPAAIPHLGVPPGGTAPSAGVYVAVGPGIWPEVIIVDDFTDHMPKLASPWFYWLRIA